jgi:hypothetical protein
MQKKPHKQGDVRDDGRIFWSYNKKSKNGERWVTKDYFNKTRSASVLHSRRWRKTNKEKYHFLQKRYRDANKEKIKLGKQRWYLNNPEKAQKLFSSRRALKRKLLHPCHSFRLEGVLASQRERLNNCLGIKFEIDHIIPLTRGGWHYHVNLHVIPMSWNRRKNNKDNAMLPECWRPEERCRFPLT